MIEASAALVTSKAQYLAKSVLLAKLAITFQDMATYIEMPKLSDTMTEGKLLKWLVKEGDEISAGDELAEVETDKATMSMESFEDGVIHKIYVPDGGVMVVGGALALLLEEDEDPPADADTPPAPPAADTPAAEEKAPAESKPAASSSASPAAAPAAPSGTGPATGGAVSADPNRRVKASPLAKKIAAERGVDLRTVIGTGPGGRITKADVVRGPVPGISVGSPGGGGGGSSSPAIRPDAGPDDERIPLSGMRTIIAERLIASKQQIPHFYLNIEIDAGPLMKMRKQVNADAEAGKDGANKYTVNDFVLKAVADAAASVPAVNASFDGDAIVQFKRIGLGVAVAVDDGLLTPVILDAAEKTLLEISLEMKDIAGKARSKKLSPDSFKGGTLTVSNLGGMGIDTFDAIVNPPQAAILSIGSIVKKPVVNDAGEIEPGLRMWIGMSCDHRVVDGAVGAAYLAELRNLLENPALMLV